MERVSARSLRNRDWLGGSSSVRGKLIVLFCFCVSAPRLALNRHKNMSEPMPHETSDDRKIGKGKKKPIEADADDKEPNVSPLPSPALRSSSIENFLGPR